MEVEGNGCGCIEAERRGMLFGTITDLVVLLSWSSGCIKYGSVGGE
jgi:hypothetical protein